MATERERVRRRFEEGAQGRGSAPLQRAQLEYLGSAGERGQTFGEAYENVKGGLQAVAAGPESIDEILAQTGRDPGEGISPLDRVRQISRMTRDQAIERLTLGRERLMEQQKRQQQEAQRDRWLALAQGMLAPTRTGGFGESLGASAGLLREQRGAEREQEDLAARRLQEIEEEMARAEEGYAEREMDILTEQARGRDVTKTFAPELYYDEVTEEIYQGLPGVDDEGVASIQWLDKEPPAEAELTPMTSLSPELQGQIARAKTEGKMEPEEVQKAATELSKGRDTLSQMYYALTLLDNIEDAGGTGGIQAIIQNAREFFGDQAQDVTDRGTLMNLMAQQLFTALSEFGTQINIRELEVAERLSAGIQRPAGVNRQLLQNLTRKLEREVKSRKNLVSKYGNARQQEGADSPLINYGVGDPLLQRAAQQGFAFEEFVPFPTREGAEDRTQPRKEGSLGTAQNPHKPQSAAEFNEMMRNREKYDIRPGDFIDVPGMGLRPVQ